MRKTRISPIQAGDIIIAKPIREDLQDKYEEMRDKLDDLRVVQSKIDMWRHKHGNRMPDKTLLRELGLANVAHQMAVLTYWAEVRTVYDLWSENISMRDGYVLVQLPDGKNPPGYIIAG